MYDLNMKEIKFPEGLMPLDIFVGSIAKERATETIEGRSGIVDYGTNYVDRPVELSMWINSSDTTDYRLLRNELYALFDTGNAFYIEETRVPSRVLKVAVDESFIPDRLTIRNASVDVTCRTLDSVFWESKYTTLELHDSGYSATAEKYGLVDNIDDEKVQYRFEPVFTTINLTKELFERGSILVSNGQNSDGDTKFGRLKNNYPVIKGASYTLSAEESSGTIRYIRVFHYDDSGVKVGESVLPNLLGNGVGEIKFNALGSSIRLLLYPEGDNQVNIDDIGTLTKISLETPSLTRKFTVYNAGNVTVEPESMFLHIFVASTTGDSITIKNNTTDEVFTLNRKMNARHIQVNGMIVTDGTTQVFRDTNKRFISLAPGDNKITVTGATFNEIRFNFKYYYK